MDQLGPRKIWADFAVEGILGGQAAVNRRFGAGFRSGFWTCTCERARAHHGVLDEQGFSRPTFRALHRSSRSSAGLARDPREPADPKFGGPRHTADRRSWARRIPMTVVRGLEQSAWRRHGVSRASRERASGRESPYSMRRGNQDERSASISVERMPPARSLVGPLSRGSDGPSGGDSRHLYWPTDPSFSVLESRRFPHTCKSSEPSYSTRGTSSSSRQWVPYRIAQPKVKCYK